MRPYFIDDHCAVWPAAVLCSVLRVSTAGYYAWRSRSEGKRAVENRALLGDIRQVHEASQGRYDIPRVHAALRAAGRRVGRVRVERLMRGHGVRGLIAQPRRVRTTDSRHPFRLPPTC